MSVSHSCPFCSYSITPDNVLFHYNNQVSYRDMRRYAFRYLCSADWETTNGFPGLYFLVSDAENDQVTRDDHGFPKTIRAKPCNGKTPTELESLELPGDPLDRFIAQFNNRRQAHPESTFAAQEEQAEPKPTDDGTCVAMSIRACPNCHNLLHPSFGQIDTVNVTLLGGPGAGKTAYLLSMTHQLSYQLSTHGLGTASLLPASKQFYEYLDRGYQRERTTMPTLPNEKLFPFVFHYINPKGEACFIRFFDIAGESTRNNDGVLNHKGSMEAETLLLLLDPNQLNNGLFYNNLNPDQSNADMESAGSQNTQYFSDCIDMYIQTSIRENLAIGAFQNIKHVIVVFSKMDQVLRSNPELFGAGRTNVDCVIRYDLENAHMGQLDTTVIDKVSRDMNVIISHELRRPYDLQALLRRQFPDPQKVTVTLLGTSTCTLTDWENITFENNVKHYASKHRIIEPVLCILARNGKIPYTKSAHPNR